LLVAQKRHNYNELPEYEKNYSPQTKVREVVVTKRGAIRKFKAVCAVILFFGLSLFILLRYAHINEYNQHIGKLKAQLNELHKVNGQLQVELDKKIDLNLIEKEAVERLGMQCPDKSQIVYVQLHRSDFTEIPETTKDEAQGEGVFGTLAQGISELVKYLY